MDAASESSSLPGLHHLNELLHWVLQQLLQFHTSVNLLLEGLLLLLVLSVYLLCFACHLQTLYILNNKCNNFPKTSVVVIHSFECLL